MDSRRRELPFPTRTARLGYEMTASIGGHFSYDRRSLLKKEDEINALD